LDSSLHHIMMTEAKSRNESIGFSLENIQWLRVEYLVLWSCSQEPVSYYIYICRWLSLFKSTDILMFFPNHKYWIKTYTFASDASIIISQPEIYSSTNFINDIFIFIHNPLSHKQHNYVLICTDVFLNCCKKKVPDDGWCKLKYVAHCRITLKCCFGWCMSLVCGIFITLNKCLKQITQSKYCQNVFQEVLDYFK
jgi:hypothetical protein